MDLFGLRSDVLVGGARIASSCERISCVCSRCSVLVLILFELLRLPFPVAEADVGNWDARSMA